MAETAALLVDHVIPDEPVRQWVLSLPFQLRYLLAAEPKVMGELLRIIYRAISTYVTKKSGLTKSNSQTGAVTLIQRFGGSINLNIHYHLTAFTRLVGRNQLLRFLGPRSDFKTSGSKIV